MRNFGINRRPMQLIADDERIMQDARNARAEAGAQFLKALFRLAFATPHQLLSRLGAAPRLDGASPSVGGQPLAGRR